MAVPQIGQRSCLPREQEYPLGKQLAVQDQAKFLTAVVQLVESSVRSAVCKLTEGCGLIAYEIISHTLLIHLRAQGATRFFRSRAGSSLRAPRALDL